MKQLISILVFCASSLLSPSFAQAQMLAPSYLSEMPAPARVVNEIKGKDAADGGARQMGAFAVLIKIMNDMAWALEHRSERQLTPDEQRITQVYTKAYTDVWQKEKDTYGRQYQGEYNNDRDLLVEVLDKFFSPNFRNQYLRTNGFAAASYNKVHANGATTGTVASNPNTGSATSPDPRTPAGTDPSIAKARAAHVDTKVYGLQLGEPLRLPTCVSSSEEVPATCFGEDESDAFIKGADAAIASIFGGSTARGSDNSESLPQVGSVIFNGPHTEWKTVYVHNGPKVEALLYDGLLALVTLDTHGINDQEQRAQELRQKYGPPTSVKPVTYTSDVGNTLKAADLEWKLPGLHVAYTVVLMKPFGIKEVLDINKGNISVETESFYLRRTAKAREQERSRTKM